MTETSDAQRIPPLLLSDWDEVSKELPAGLRRPQMEPLQIMTTLGRHPVLLRSWLQFAGRLAKGALPARLRELVVLRTLWRCHGVYEWGPHVAAARTAGLTGADIEHIVTGPQAWADGGVERSLLLAVDQLHDAATIDDQVWTALAAQLEEQELIELPMLVGQYHLASFVVNALHIEPEPGTAPFPTAGRPVEDSVRVP